MAQRVKSQGGPRETRRASGPARPIGRPADEKELHALADIGVNAFGAHPERMRDWLAGLGLDAVRVYRRRGEVIGGLVLHAAGQWFGGRCVPMTGVALVCVTGGMSKMM